MQLACRWILLVCKAGSSKVAQDEILSMVGPTKNVFLAAIMGSEINRILVDISLKLYAFVFLLSLTDCFSAYGRPLSRSKMGQAFERIGRC